MHSPHSATCTVHILHVENGEMAMEVEGGCVPELTVEEPPTATDAMQRTSVEDTALVDVDKVYVEELVHLLSLAKHPHTTALLQSALEEARASQVGSKTPARTTTLTGGKATKEKSSSYSTRINEYGWDQSDRFVKLYITNIAGLDKLSQECLHTQFKESIDILGLKINDSLGLIDHDIPPLSLRSMEVELVGVQGRNYSLVIKDLFSPVMPGECTAKVRSGVVTISLRKSKKEQWEFITRREKVVKDAKEVKPPKAGKDDDPQAGIMQLMKKMYDDGDDEMKRTIAKAWTESRDKQKQDGGAAL